MCNSCLVKDRIESLDIHPCVLFYRKMTFIGHGVRQGMWRTASVEICAPIIPDSRDTLGLVRKRKKKELPGLFASVFIDTHTSLICVWLCQGLSESDRKKRGHSELWLYRQSTSSEPIHPQSSRPSRQHRLPLLLSA